MKIFFLEASMPLVKTYTQAADGSVTKDPYPNAYEFTSHETFCPSLKHLETELVARAKLGQCLLKGVLSKPLVKESRAGSTDSISQTQWICLDIDGLRNVANPEDFVKILATKWPTLAEVSYVVQYSSSMGVDPSRGLSCHIFLYLKAPVAPATLKQWLAQINLELFPGNISLTRSHMSLRWPVDVTTCQNDKLLYIAPPKCIPASMDKFRGARVQYVKKGHELFDFSGISVPPAETLKTKADEVLATLRKNAGLPEKKKISMKTHAGVQYLSRPDLATITGVREERGFVYLNLNGGDSWGYYHPKDNANFVYNFKGEPTYLTKELLPDYYTEFIGITNVAQQQTTATRIYLAFRDFRSAEYYNGWYDSVSNELRLAQAKSESQLKDFLEQYNQPIPDVFTDWDVIYDPTAPLGEVINFDKRTINLFKPSLHMHAPDAALPPITKVPPIIDKLIRSMIGNDPTLNERFHNHIAFILRHRVAPTTAWILQGIEGTGKGMFVNKILTNLLGIENVAVKRMEELEDRFNGHLENSLVCFVDEAEISASQHSKRIMANLKNQITEPFISIRKMRTQSYMVRNHVAWFFSSNMPDPVVLGPTDRRHYVGEFMRNRFFITDADIDTMVFHEIPQYAAYLHQVNIDYDWLRQPLMNDAKMTIINASRTSIDAIANAIKTGDLPFLWDSLPENEDLLDLNTAFRAQQYKTILISILRTNRTWLTRDELQVIFAFNMGNVPTSPIKFTQFLSHHDIIIKPIKDSTQKSIRGVTVKWDVETDWLNERLAELSTTTHPKLEAIK